MKRQILQLIIAVISLVPSLVRAQASAPILLRIPPSSQAGRELVLAPITRKPMHQRISATATIEPDAEAIADVSSVIPARVIKLIAQPGQWVHTNEPLAMLSSVELGESKAEYLRARSLEAITVQNLNRERDLYAKKITPAKDLLEARARYDAALAEYKAAREKLRLLIAPADLNTVQWSDHGHPLSEFPLVSPIAGTLVRRDLRIGGMLDRNEPAPITVINLERVWVVASIFEHDLAGLKPGDPAEISVDSYPNRTFTGNVTYIGDEINRITRAVLARIEVPNLDRVLKPGMFAHALIETSAARPVVVAPESAIYEVDGKQVVFVPSDQGGYVERTVTLGAHGPGTVEILAGLNPGDRVVAKGGLALKTLISNRAAD
jgi:cobalt-zinc-cadmium efflux system membrane fusion protein